MDLGFLCFKRNKKTKVGPLHIDKAGAFGDADISSRMSESTEQLECTEVEPFLSDDIMADSDALSYSSNALNMNNSSPCVQVNKPERVTSGKISLPDVREKVRPVTPKKKLHRPKGSLRTCEIIPHKPIRKPPTPENKILNQQERTASRIQTEIEQVERRLKVIDDEIEAVQNRSPASWMQCGRPPVRYRAEIEASQRKLRELDERNEQIQRYNRELCELQYDLAHLMTKHRDYDEATDEDVQEFHRLSQALLHLNSKFAALKDTSPISDDEYDDDDDRDDDDNDEDIDNASMVAGLDEEEKKMIRAELEALHLELETLEADSDEAPSTPNSLTGARLLKPISRTEDERAQFAKITGISSRSSMERAKRQPPTLEKKSCLQGWNAREKPQTRTFPEPSARTPASSDRAKLVPQQSSLEEMPILKPVTKPVQAAPSGGDVACDEHQPPELPDIADGNLDSHIQARNHVANIFKTDWRNCGVNLPSFIDSRFTAIKHLNTKIRQLKAGMKDEAGEKCLVASTGRERVRLGQSRRNLGNATGSTRTFNK